jgi:PAS domain S-box-containing protein
MKIAECFERLPDLHLLVEGASLRVLDVHAPSGALGHSRAALLGTSLDALVVGCTPKLIDDALAHRHDPHPDAPLRVMAHRADGAETPADVRVSQAAPGMVLVSLRPISEAARIAERELVTIVCAAPAAIITWGFDGRIISFNPAAVKLYGMETVEAIGRPISTLVPERERDELKRAEARLRVGESVGPREVTRLRRPGLNGDADAEVEVEESLFLIRDVANHPVRVGSVTREMTELVRLRRATEILSCEAPRATGVLEEEPGSAMREVNEAVEVAAREGAVTVLLLGETGVGKSRHARRIHALSERASRPFLEVNCASLEPALVESELFGHERGAFTGATSSKRGLVEAAAGGTLFLDEIGELPPPVQAKLLAFLDDRVFRRVGGEVNLRSDTRVLAATNADLDARVRQGAFRRDLYYRLRVLPIRIPPLRERRDELPELAKAVVAELRPRPPRPSLSRDLVAALVRYGWPGNLRELRNALERALLLSRGGDLALGHLPPEVRGDPPASMAVSDETLEAVERAHIERVLASTGGNRSAAAMILGISRSTLNRKLAAWGQGDATWLRLS